MDINFKNLINKKVWPLQVECTCKIVNVHMTGNKIIKALNSTCEFPTQRPNPLVGPGRLGCRAIHAMGYSASKVEPYGRHAIK